MKMNASATKMSEQRGIALLTTVLLLLLMSSMLVGFIVLINSSQKLNSNNNDYGRAFYGAEAGMEKMTADLGNLFDANYSPTASQVQAITTTPPSISGINYVKGDGTSGYQITYPGYPGSPTATNATIKSGPYQGMTALSTPYTLTVNARTVNGAEVKLQRTTQTVGIPMFQFGIFSDPDLSFHAGPTFNFGGRVHTNGNLWLAQGDGTTLTMSDRVTAVKDIIRTNMADGWPTTSGYNGTVNITTSPGTSSYRAMAMNEGSLTGNIGSSANPNWNNISLGTTNYAGNVRNGATGAKNLNLGIVTVGSGSTQAIDIIRRPISTENGAVTAERYFAQASLKILLSDNPGDIMSLPCIDSSTQPFDLSQLAQPVANWPSTTAITNLKTKMTAAGTIALPLAASGAQIGVSTYNSTDGYWLPNAYPIIKGFIKIEAQENGYGTPCGTWTDVTLEILSLGYVGGNLNPMGGLSSTQYGTASSSKGVPLLALPTTGQLGANPCAAPHPNAVIRLERVRDNPSTWTSGNPCGTVSSTSPASDFWPNTLFDTREGELRETQITSGTTKNLPTLNGTIHYVEVDAKNLAKWFAGTIGTTGALTKDAAVAPNDFVVYISDRRGNYAPSQTWTGTWPPLSPQGHETGEYGWTDFANGGDAANGCPNNTLNSGEDLDGTGQQYTYGANNAYIAGAGAALSTLYTLSGSNITGTVATAYGKYGVYNNLVNGSTGAIIANPNCSIPSYSSSGGGTMWPMMFANNNNAARENPPLFFRRAVKVVNGNNLTALGTCPGAVACGLTIATENPIYIQGDYNANSAGGGFNDAHVAASVLADSLTFLSNSWNDANSFSYNEYNIGAPRTPTQTYYRTAVVAGKGIAFPYFGSSGDNGSDGGVHNFLRYIENWGAGGLTLYYRGSIISMYFNRQNTGIFKCCGTVYTPPSRGYNFDTEFLTPALLPPRTPLFRDVNTTGFTQLLLPNQ
jgi:Tfp pilus assembly protein PilX